MAGNSRKTRSILKTLLDILLPPVCYRCGGSCSSTYGFCEECLQKIRGNSPASCPKCGRRLLVGENVCNECSPKAPAVEKAWSCCYYRDTIKECVHLFKYKGYLGASDILKDMMLDFAKKNEIHKNIDLIVPVPLYSTKKRERSFNHAEVLARSLSKYFEIPMDAGSLKKIRWTQSQSELDRKERLKNVKDSFLVVDRSTFSGKTVLLVDDVYTTGATINECAKALLDANARKVFSLTLARGA